MNHGLTSIVPTELKKLAELQGLHLAGTALTGALSVATCIGDFDITYFESNCAARDEADVQCSCCTVCCEGIHDEPDTCGGNPFVKALSVLLAEADLDKRALSSLETPQSQALNWLAVSDPAMLDFEKTSPRTILERYIIATLYYSTNGPTWKDQRGFLSKESVCKWSLVNATETTIKGVVCNDQDEFVAEINLSESQLAGKIPSEIGLLTSLTVVDLSKFLSVLSLTKCFLSLTSSLSIVLSQV
jgi:hypothetical protein